MNIKFQKIDRVEILGFRVVQMGMPSPNPKKEASKLAGSKSESKSKS
jgi:hypothetical protein